MIIYMSSRQTFDGLIPIILHFFPHLCCASCLHLIAEILMPSVGKCIVVWLSAHDYVC